MICGVWYVNSFAVSRQHEFLAALKRWRCRLVGNSTAPTMIAKALMNECMYPEGPLKQTINVELIADAKVDYSASLFRFLGRHGPRWRSVEVAESRSRIYVF